MALGKDNIKLTAFLPDPKGLILDDSGCMWCNFVVVAYSFVVLALWRPQSCDSL